MIDLIILITHFLKKRNEIILTKQEYYNSIEKVWIPNPKGL